MIVDEVERVEWERQEAARERRSQPVTIIYIEGSEERRLEGHRAESDFERECFEFDLQTALRFEAGSRFYFDFNDLPPRSPGMSGPE